MWLESSVDISVRMAQRYIQLARAFPDATSISHLGMTKALALLELPESRREAFITEMHEVNGITKNIDELSVRDVERIIRETTGVEKPSNQDNSLRPMRKKDQIELKIQNFELDLKSAQKHLNSMAKFLESRPNGFPSEKPLIIFVC